MPKYKYAVGYQLSQTAADNKKFLDIVADVKGFLHDIHIAHYNPSEMASGRFVLKDGKKTTLQFIEDALEEGFRPSLLINYLFHKDYDTVINVFKRDYYSRGLRSVVVADIELIRRLKEKFPDLYIQGSLLSYRSTKKELLEESEAGVDIHNPTADIIRNPEQIRRNHKAGFVQKVIPFEGCFNKCKHERAEKGHRWHTARNLPYKAPDICLTTFAMDLRQFFRANWTTTKRLDQFSDCIEVVKMPRGTDRILEGQRIYAPITAVKRANAVKAFIDIVENSKHFNIADFNATCHAEAMRRYFRSIPSELFDNRFLSMTDSCKRKCDYLGCRACWVKAKQMQPFLRDPKKYEIRGVSIVKKNSMFG